MGTHSPFENVKKRFQSRVQQEPFYNILHTVYHKYKQNVQLLIALETEQQNHKEVFRVSYKYREISHLYNMLNLATRKWIGVDYSNPDM